MQFNWYIILVAGLVPLIVGFVWYNPKVFGTAWMGATGLTPESAQGANMGKIFGLTYLFSCMAALAIMPIVIHQMGFFSMVAELPGLDDPTTENGMMFKNMMDKYGQNFRTFKHGALHGTILGIFLGMPIMAVNAMFERKGFKYVAINAGYWMVCFLLMGGVICAFI